MSAPIKPGDACPSLTLLMSDETSMRIPASNGRGIVLFFYPKDNTPGCTTESKAFSALLGDFQEKGYDVVGISRDSIASHRKFIEKQDLRIPLERRVRGTQVNDVLVPEDDADRRRSLDFEGADFERFGDVDLRLERVRRRSELARSRMRSQSR